MEKKKKTTNKKVDSKKKTTTKKSSTTKKVTKTKKVEQKKKTTNIKEDTNIKKVSTNEPKNNKRTTLIEVLGLLIVGILSLFMYFKSQDNKEIKRLNDEIDTIIDYVNKEDIDIKKIESDFSSNVTNEKMLDMENKVENYLLEIATIKDKFKKILNNDNLKNALDSEYLIKEETLNYLKESSSEISNLKEKYNKIKIDSSKLEDEEYKNLIDKINKNIVLDDFDSNIEYVSELSQILEFTTSNSKYFELEDDSIIFNKRKVKEEFDTLISNLNCDRCKTIESKLIEDKTAPVITASNISITKGTSIDIKSKVKCVDAVDDTVDCKIDGNYDKNKVGEYKIKITSSDKSGNRSEKTIKVIVSEKKTNTSINSSKPYYIEVIRNQNTVVVYGKDENNKYTKIVKVFVCSVGRNNYTPTGTFTTKRGSTWGGLFGGVYGQYTTRITGNILFHSVPYYSKNKNDLEWEEYNKLGTAASAGCVRMAVRDVKWIYDNVANGTTVKIYDGSLPSGVSKPSAIKIPSNSPNKGWDPTDPDSNNPWKK